jgi:hypothetical protein
MDNASLNYSLHIKGQDFARLGQVTREVRQVYTYLFANMCR